MEYQVKKQKKFNDHFNNRRKKMDLLEKIDMYVGDVNESKYNDFVKKKLEDGGKSLGEMSDEETKEFFAMIKKEWKG